MDRKERIKATARRLYEGKEVPHHSCGICMAVTFGCAPKSYQSLRKGGINGEGECGAIKGGEMVIGEYLGDPNPTGAVTDALRAGIAAYRQMLAESGYSKPEQIACNELVKGYPDFLSDERKAFCADLVVDICQMVAAVLEDHGVAWEDLD
jgi:hypothetical protein